MSFILGFGFFGSLCGVILLVTSGEVIGFKFVEEDWVGRGCFSYVVDDFILGKSALLGKVIFTFELGDEVGVR